MASIVIAPGGGPVPGTGVKVCGGEKGPTSDALEDRRKLNHIHTQRGGQENTIAFFGGGANVVGLKTQILDLSRKVNRGLTETAEDRRQIEKLFKQLEAKSPTKSPLTQPSKADGLWSLEYTTSDSILGRGGYDRVGPILQMIDTKNLKAENSETIGFFGLKIPRKVTAELTPMTKRELDITYVDEDLRLSRGDKGNIFVLTRARSKG